MVADDSGFVSALYDSTISLDPQLLAQADSLMEKVAMCTFVVFPKEKRLFFSRGMTDIIGPVAAEDMLLENFLEFTDPTEQRNLKVRYEEAFYDLAADNHKVVSFEHNIISRTGHLYHVRVNMQAVKKENHLLIFGMMEDYTSSFGEIVYEKLLSDSIDGYVFCYESDTDYVRFNSSLAELLDFPTHDLKHATKEIGNLVNPEDYSAFLSIMQDDKEKKDRFGLDFRILSPVQGEVWVHSCGVFDFTSPDQKHYKIGILVDITDKKKMNSLQRLIIDGSEAITFTADMKRGIIEFSPNLKDAFPDMELRYTGDIIHLMAEEVIEDDRKRFIETFTYLVDEGKDTFSIEFRVWGNDDQIRWLASRGKTVYDSSKQALVIIGTIFDLTSMNEMRENVEKNSSRNSLTGLLVRDRLISDLDAKIHDRDVLSAAVVLVDIKDFHVFNDRYGREAGDRLLVTVAKKLRESLPNGCELYHINLDVFCILWSNATRVQVENHMKAIKEEMNEPLTVDRSTIYVSFSMSAALFPSCGNVAEELLVNAEITLHKVKQDPRLTYSIYTPQYKVELKERLDFEFQISKSVREGNQNFLLYFQPLVDARSERLVGCEALLRWMSPQGNLISPEKVIAAVNATGQMNIVGDWILRTAIKQCKTWIDSGVSEDFYVHINVTAEDMARIDFADYVIELLNEYGVQPKNILLEITETSLMKNLAICRQNMSKLRSNGIRIALDDFGTGYSSFNYLREFPVDEIKIDRAFVDQDDRFNTSFISAIVLLTRTIGMTVCVEGIETAQKASRIRSLGVDIFQGYYFARPLSPEDFEKKYFSGAKFRASKEEVQERTRRGE
ncbi:MAG: EAL domain-containing protein [Clostridiales bacterium]|nr:EAL domain-containing protein [Clostridiales bacterium]